MDRLKKIGKYALFIIAFLFFLIVGKKRRGKEEIDHQEERVEDARADKDKAEQELKKTTSEIKKTLILAKDKSEEIKHRKEDRDEQAKPFFPDL